MIGGFKKNSLHNMFWLDGLKLNKKTLSNERKNLNIIQTEKKFNSQNL